MISTKELLKKRQEILDNYGTSKFDAEKWIQQRREMEDIVTNCKFETPEEVANHFIAYTAVIWDYKMIGKIYECYHGDVTTHCMNHDNITNADAVVADTLKMMAACSDLRLIFNNIFCERYEGEGGGYRFGQSVYFEGTNDGWTPFGPPTYRKLNKDNAMALCECLVQFQAGRWRIVEEWRSGDTFDELFSAPAEEAFASPAKASPIDRQ